MGKASRNKRHRHTSVQRRTVVVDSCEIGQHGGSLTFRVGDLDSPPVCIAVPAPMAIDLVHHLRSASLAAEENYWNVVPHVLRGLAPDADERTVAKRLETWLLAQDWAGLLRRVPAAVDAGIALVTCGGHIGVTVPPPLTDRDTLAIFDPLQIRRLAPSLQSALVEACTQPPPPALDAVAATVAFLADQPWPSPIHRELTDDEVQADMDRAYRQFLARAPYVPPDAHLLQDGDEDGGP